MMRWVSDGIARVYGVVAAVRESSSPDVEKVGDGLVAESALVAGHESTVSR
jgi:hypothetical protein